MKKTNLILVTLILTLSLAGCKEKLKEAEHEKKVTADLSIETADIKTSDYEIVKTENQSRKALEKK